MLRHLSRSRPAPHTGAMLALALAILTAPARAEPPVPPAAVPGATLDEVLAIARKLSPDLAARALVMCPTTNRSPAPSCSRPRRIWGRAAWPR